MSQSTPVFLHVTLKIRPGCMKDFCTLMQKLKAVAETGGWKLIGSWTNMIGRFNVVVDIWELKDSNQVQSVFAAFYAHPDWPAWERQLADYVEDEVTQIMTPLAF